MTKTWENPGIDEQPMEEKNDVGEIGDIKREEKGGKEEKAELEFDRGEKIY